MRADQVPPTPDHIADLLEKIYVRHNLLEKKYIETMRKFYKISKEITHRDIQEVKGPEYEKLYQEADDFIKKMKKLVEKGKF